jgi:hypothetical protein
MLCLPCRARGQANADRVPDDPPVQQQLKQLQTELEETRGQVTRAEQRIEELLQEVHELRRDLGVAKTALPQPQESQGEPYASAADREAQQTVAQQNVTTAAPDMTENERLLAQRLEEQQQTKVESASKYRVKLTGLMLFNAYTNRGGVDVADVPNKARAGQPSVAGATLRQSLFGLQVFGPEIAGARTSGSVFADFFGGFPRTFYGTTNGIVRLRTASARFDWQNTSLTIGQESPFFAPLSPTSFASLVEPAFSWAGNLWVWTPQVNVEHRFHTSDDTYWSLTGGVLAPLTEDPPDSSQFAGISPGARGHRPAVASHLAWNSQYSGQPLTIGVGAYTSHLDYDFGRNFESWATTADWRIPLGHLVEISGEAYRGRAVGGLGGGIWQTVLANGNPDLSSTTLRPLNSVGGWSQLKLRPFTKWELNTAIGQDNVLAEDLRWTPTLTGEYFPPLARNREALTNVIYRPKSNLLLSAEYRYMWTFGYVGPRRTAAHVNLAAGVSF